MKVYDCFTFFNEIDLLKIRLEFLEEVVDYFVIVESNITFSGNDKEYNLENNWDDFKKWHNKMLYIKIQQSKEDFSFQTVNSYTPTNGSWKVEYQQRNAIQYIAEEVEDDDIVLIGDVDEIPIPQAIENIKSTLIKSRPQSLTMLFHYYYMNCQNIGYERWWNGTIACKGSDFKTITPQEHRDNRNHYYRYNNAGYHFSFLGGAEKIKTKIESFAHTELNREDIKSEQNIREALEKGKDIFNRPGVAYKTVRPEEYPEDLRNLMYKYPQFIKYED